MESLAKDLRYSIRMLVKRPLVTAIAVLTLALGIGANTAIFSVVNGVLLASLPYEDGNRLALVYSARTSRDIQFGHVSFPDFADWREQSESFEDLAAFRSSGFILTGAGEPERLEAGRVSASFFHLLRVSAARGRLFEPTEDQAGSNRLVVISDGLWKRRFGGDEGLIGRSLTLNGTPYTVIGVLPAGFSFPLDMSGCEVWCTTAFEGSNLEQRGSHLFKVLARLKPGFTLEQGQAEMDAIAGRLEQQYPEENTGKGLTVIGLHERLVGDVRLALHVLLGAVGLLLLIACSNVANLLLARSSERQKEIAIRTALGASRRRVIRQLLTESLMLALMGGAAGLLLATWGIELLISFSPEDLPLIDAVRMDQRVFGFTLCASLMTGLVFGLAPAIRLSRPDLTESLKEGGRGGATGPARHRLRGLLVISEVALALILLVGAGLLMKSFIRLQRVDPGFKPENLLSANISLPDLRYPEPHQRIAFVQQALESIEALPGVKSAAFVTPAPFSGRNIGSSFAIAGRPEPTPGNRPNAGIRGATPGYFRTMGIPLLRGREFTDADRRGKVGTVIINSAMAKRYWPDEDPVGQRLSEIGVSVDDDEPSSWEIVGIVGDVKHSALDQETAPEIYIPHRQQSWGWLYLVVRTESPPMSLVSAIRGQILEIDPDLPLAGVSPVETQIDRSIAQPRFYMLLMAIFAGMGLILAVVGVYGVISYSVMERTHEIGIRIALGASGREILELVIRRGMLFAVVGILTGLVGALTVTRLMTSLLFEVSATDLTVYILLPVLLAFVALAACLVPARRAMKVDPIVALRYE